MRSWNLSTLEEMQPDVLVPMEKENTVSIKVPRKNRMPKFTRSMAAGIGTVAIVASMSLGAITVSAQGSDTELRFTASSVESSNVRIDRSPLSLLFGGQHPLKWDEAKHSEMLAKAAEALSKADKNANNANLIQGSLRENLPASREDAFDLSKLGIKLG